MAPLTATAGGVGATVASMHRPLPRTLLAAVAIAFGAAACGSEDIAPSPLENKGASAAVETEFEQAPTTVAEPLDGNSASSSTTPHLEPLRGQFKVEVINEIPHDSTSYVQGLIFEDGRLLESQGLRGESARSWIDAEDGSIQSSVPINDPELFAEGIALVDGEFVQLTWQAGRALVGDGASLTASSEFSYAGEGWGLCFDGTQLIRSDGTNTLSFHDPKTFELTGSVQVTASDGQRIESLNELECVGNQVIANVWGWEQLMVIDARTGQLDAVIDASSLRPDGVPLDLDHALNGVAYDPETDTYYLTGKLWPSIFQVRIIPS